MLTLCRKRCILFRHSTRGHHKPVRGMKKVLIGRKKCLTGWRIYGILIELPLRNQRKTQECLKRGWKNFLTKWNTCVKLIKLLIQNSDDIKRKVLIRNEKVLDKLECLMYNKKAHINERNIAPCKLNNVTWTNYKPEILLKFILRKRTGRCKTGIKITASQHIAEIFDYNELYS